MKHVKKIFVFIFILSILNCYIVGNIFANQIKSDSKKGVTETTIEIRSTPGLKLFGKKDQKNQTWFSKYKWWIIGGALAAIGGAAIALNGDSSENPPAYGDYTGRW